MAVATRVEAATAAAVLTAKVVATMVVRTADAEAPADLVVLWVAGVAPARRSPDRRSRRGALGSQSHTSNPKACRSPHSRPASPSTSNRRRCPSKGKASHTRSRGPQPALR